MTHPPGPPRPPAAALPPAAAAEPRQRWRLTFSRQPVPADAVGRLAIEAWQEALAGSGLPVAGLELGGPGRARIAFAAPLPAAARGEAELVDIWLLERRAAWQVREALAARLPAAHRWIAAENVWLGAPALAGRVAAADWRVALTFEAAVPAGRDRLVDAARSLLAARTLPRIRAKGAAEKHYDLRVLLADIVIVEGTEPGALGARIRTRFDPELGSGRPEEVVAALADAAGCPIVAGSITRERLVLADVVPNRPSPPATPRARPPRR